jgi:hypothetical protein
VNPVSRLPASAARRDPWARRIASIPVTKDGSKPEIPMFTAQESPGIRPNGPAPIHRWDVDGFGVLGSLTGPDHVLERVAEVLAHRGEACELLVVACRERMGPCAAAALPLLREQLVLPGAAAGSEALTTVRISSASARNGLLPRQAHFLRPCQRVKVNQLMLVKSDVLPEKTR